MPRLLRLMLLGCLLTGSGSVLTGCSGSGGTVDPDKDAPVMDNVPDTTKP